MKKAQPARRHGHTQAEELKHLKHRFHELAETVETLMSTAADLTAAVADLTKAVADLSAQPPALITQAELDAATQGVLDASAVVKTKTPPTP